jgi:hypothetical protein
MTDLSQPPAGECKWSVSWLNQDGFVVMDSVRAHTAFEAHSRVPGAPAFGECLVRRVEN